VKGDALFDGQILSDVELAAQAARVAGKIGLQYFGQKPDVWIKGKDSPVSEADIAIDTYLKETLLRARPHYGWLSEETEDNDARLSKERIFIVDPIDGTRGFIQGTENWMVSIAVVENGKPTVGVLYGPVMDRLYLASAGGGATCNGVAISASNSAALSDGEFSIPARIADTIQENLESQFTRARHIHSLAYRIALVADGSLAGTIARPHARDWDVAAADLIVREAGGVFTGLNGSLPRYNRKSTKHDWLLASGQAVKTPLKNALIEAIEKTTR